MSDLKEYSDKAKEALFYTECKLTKLGETMQRTMHSIKTFNNSFNRFGAIVEYQIQQQQAVDTCFNLISILDPYWKDKHKTLHNLAERRSVKSATTFISCLTQIQQEVYEGVMLNIENNRKIREFKVYLIERGWI